MTFEEKKLIFELMKIKDSCGYDLICPKDHKCDFKTQYGTCGFYGHTPKSWNIPTIPRWTPEDVALAKALKAFGAMFLVREKSGAITVHFNNGDLCEAPVLAFKGIPDGSCHIDNIIKESEG